MAQYQKALCCPSCNSTNFIRSGKVKNIQRYICKNCKRSFRDTSKTPIHHIHKKDNVSLYIEALQLGLSVRKAASYAGISKNTSFIWRHKFLMSLSKQVRQCETEKAAGVLVLKQPFSEKGKKNKTPKVIESTSSLVVVAGTELWIHKLQPSNTGLQIKIFLHEILKKCHVINKPDPILSRAIRQHKSMRPVSLHELKMECLSQVNNAELHLTSWMGRFKGVATKYLQQYWNWYLCLHHTKMLIKSRLQFEERCMKYYNKNEFMSLLKS